MISIMGKKWKQRKINKNSVEKLKQDHNFSEILSKLVISRNFDKSEIHSIENNLYPSNVFSNNNDFNESIELIESAIKHKDIICILGDYDVDGSAATSLLVRFFESVDHPFFFIYLIERLMGMEQAKSYFKN